jgi:hypothetical protein
LGLIVVDLCYFASFEEMIESVKVFLFSFRKIIIKNYFLTS